MQASDRLETKETAGVIVRPPLLFIGALLLGLALDRVLLLPYSIGSDAPLPWIGAAMILAGAALMAAAFRGFSRADTPVPTNRPTRALVTTGVHGWSRNPIYCGMFLIYGGIAVAAESLGMVILLLPLALVIRHGVVAREEAYLERSFGDAYRRYRSEVRRWLGRSKGPPVARPNAQP